MKYIVNNFDMYMCKLREAENTPKEKRTKEQNELIEYANNSPTFNQLFGRN